MKNDMPELKACPFCGSKPRVSPKDPKIEGDAWTQIRCVKCDIGFTAYADTGHYNKAANKWNTRTDLATPNQCCGARGKEACTRYDQDGEECDVKRAGVDDGLLADAVEWAIAVKEQSDIRISAEEFLADDHAKSKHLETLITHALKTREEVVEVTVEELITEKDGYLPFEGYKGDSYIDAMRNVAAALHVMKNNYPNGIKIVDGGA